MWISQLTSKNHSLPSRSCISQGRPRWMSTLNSFELLKASICREVVKFSHEPSSMSQIQHSLTHSSKSSHSALVSFNEPALIEWRQSERTTSLMNISKDTVALIGFDNAHQRSPDKRSEIKMQNNLFLCWLIEFYDCHVFGDFRDHQTSRTPRSVEARRLILSRRLNGIPSRVVSYKLVTTDHTK